MVSGSLAVGVSTQQEGEGARGNATALQATVIHKSLVL